MLHIRPVQEKDASQKVQAAYQDIKETLHIHFVPLLFQYIAGYEEYFLYAWDKYKQNIQSDYYHKATQELIQLSQKSIQSIYHESREMSAFIHSLPDAEKHTIAQTVEELLQLNTILLILTIGLREGVKGVVIGQQILPHTGVDYEETVFDEFINQKIMHNNLKNSQNTVASSTSMLAPLFGSHSLVISKFPAFFSHVAREMDRLAATEKYLEERVNMEQQALVKALHLPYPLGCSYAEIAQLAGKKPYFSELLYILAETFPLLWEAFPE